MGAGVSWAVASTPTSDLVILGSRGATAIRAKGEEEEEEAEGPRSSLSWSDSYFNGFDSSEKLFERISFTNRKLTQFIFIVLLSVCY